MKVFIPIFHCDEVQAKSKLKPVRRAHTVSFRPHRQPGIHARIVKDAKTVHDAWGTLRLTSSYENQLAALLLGCVSP